MKICLNLFIIAVMSGAAVTMAQTRPPGRPQAAPKTTGNYSSDVDTVVQAEKDAVEQAKQALADAQDPAIHSALETAIKEMQKAQTALDAAKDSPDKLKPA